MANVFKQYVEGLEELDTHVASRLLTQDVQEERKHVFLQEEAEHTQESTHRHIQESVHGDWYRIIKRRIFLFCSVQVDLWSRPIPYTHKVTDLITTMDLCCIYTLLYPHVSCLSILKQSNKGNEPTTNLKRKTGTCSTIMFVRILWRASTLWYMLISP